MDTWDVTYIFGHKLQAFANVNQQLKVTTFIIISEAKLN